MLRLTKRIRTIRFLTTVFEAETIRIGISVTQLIAHKTWIFTDFEVGNQRPDLYVGKNFTVYVGNFCRILCRDFKSVNVGIAHLDLPEYTPFLSKFLSSSHFYFYLKKFYVRN